MVHALAPVEFAVLGSLRVRRDGQDVHIGPAYKSRLTLAALSAQADHAVSVQWLIQAVWGDDPPVSARRNIQLYVHHLRRALGPGRVISRPGGYALLAGEELDAERFRALAARGAAALDTGDAAEGSDRLRAALDLWRGTAFAEFRESDLICDEAARLEQLRLVTFERWAEAELALGRHVDLAVELTGLTQVHPFRETLRAHLMRALYGAGRQAEALEVYRNTRTLLIEELGVEPGPALRQLHEQMLRGETLTMSPGHPGGTAATAPRHQVRATHVSPRELPADVRGFAGREDALAALDELLLDGVDGLPGPVVISAIAGTAGIGKTALAVRWAHRVVGRFPDGQLYVNLRGYALGAPIRPVDALGGFLRALGVAAEQVPVDVTEASTRYRTMTAGKRLLIILDNAASAEQVRPLIPGGPRCLVVVTSRDRLTGLIARDGARRVTVDVLTASEAEHVLSHVIGAERVAAEPSAVAALATACAHLPLALRIAGASLADQPGRAIADYVAELAEGDPAHTLAVDGDEDSSVRGAFDLSLRTMPAQTQLVFRRLGLVPLPDFTVAAVAALADLSIPAASRELDRLACAHLVEPPRRKTSTATSPHSTGSTPSTTA